MSATLNAYPNYVGNVLSGNYTNGRGTILDLSGFGVDLSNTQILKVAPFNNNQNSFYALMDLSRNYVNKVDCSGANIIRVSNGTVRPVGYIHNSNNVNAFVCDTSGNLWVGGDSMLVKANEPGSLIANTTSIFTVPLLSNTPQPTGLINVDVSGCNDLCPVEDLMMGSVVDLSGVCLNFSNTSTLTVGNVVFPRIRDNTSAFSMTISPYAGGPNIPSVGLNTDLSGHRLVAFRRSGLTGLDVSGFYVLRSNQGGSTAVGDVANTSYVNLNGSLSFKNISFDSGRNKLYAVRDVDDKHPVMIPLDISSNVTTVAYTVKRDAQLKYASPTSTTLGAVDSSGFMVVCTNPSTANTRPVVRLDSSGSNFGTLTLIDVSGVRAMDVATTSNLNHILLVDASRNSFNVEDPTKNTKGKIGIISLSSRSSNTNNYTDGSGIRFVQGGISEFNYDISGAYIRDLKVDSCGNVFMGGHQIYVQNDLVQESANIQATQQVLPPNTVSLSTSTSDTPLIGNDIDYDKQITLTPEVETREAVQNFINNRSNQNLDMILNPNRARGDIKKIL
jgi:hypothetical protein